VRPQLAPPGAHAVSAANVDCDYWTLEQAREGAEISGGER
jgi:hypothetical protein